MNIREALAIVETAALSQAVGMDDKEKARIEEALEVIESAVESCPGDTMCGQPCPHSNPCEDCRDFWAWVDSGRPLNEKGIPTIYLSQPENPQPK